MERFASGRPPIADDIDLLGARTPEDAFDDSLFEIIRHECIEHTLDEAKRLARSEFDERVPASYLEDTVEREATFAHALLRSVTELAEDEYMADRKITLMLDVDLTSGVNVNDDGQQRTIPRPGLAPAIKALRTKYGERFEVGILSTRPQDHLVNDADYFSEIQSTINTEFIFSSHDSTLAQTLDPELLADQKLTEIENLRGEARLAAEQQLRQKRLAAVAGIVTHDVIDMPDATDYYHEKLLILEQLSQTNPDRVFVLLDDLLAAAAVDPNHPGVRGIHVAEHAQARLADHLSYTDLDAIMLRFASDESDTQAPAYEEQRLFDVDHKGRPRLLV